MNVLDFTGVENSHKYLVIDPDTRQIRIPKAEEVFGVEEDSKAERKYFLAPRYVGDGLDLSAGHLQVNFRNANGDEDIYLVRDVEAVGDAVTFSWELSHKVTAYKGKIQFLVCASFTEPDGTLAAKWHTGLAVGRSLGGLEPDADGVEETTSDVIAQLLTVVDAQIAAVEAEGDAQIERIQNQFNVFATKTDAANAIKGNLSGAVVFADDVSPLDHSPKIWVHGKNLLRPEPGAAWQCTAEISDDGKITLKNTATSGVAFARVGTIKLKKGHTYVYSRFDPTNVMNVLTWLTGTTTESWYPVHGEPFTPSNDVVVDVAVYMSDISAIGNTSSIYIQIEEGETATEYEPYIDPTTAEVTRCGKAVFSKASQSVSGENKAWASLLVAAVKCPPGDYVAGCRFKQVGADKATVAMSIRTYNDYTAPFGDASSAETEGNLLKQFTVTPGSGGFQIYLYSNTLSTALTTECYFENLYVEAGTEPTGYEVYKGEKFTPNADGTVEGVTSISPNMTILTDTEGVTVECEYNKDTEKHIEAQAERFAVKVVIDTSDNATADKTYKEINEALQSGSKVVCYIDYNGTKLPYTKGRLQCGTVIQNTLAGLLQFVLTLDMAGMVYMLIVNLTSTATTTYAYRLDATAV